MTFDMQKASQICDNVQLDENGELKALDQYAMAGAELLRPALDEIERLGKWAIKNRDAATDLQYQLDEQVDIVEKQAKRIAELEILLDVARKDEEWVANKFGAKIDKQRAALKKLGQAKRERGKALVEERAKDGAKLPELCDIVHDELMCPALDGNCEHWEGCPRKDKLRRIAREQLRREGKL